MPIERLVLGHPAFREYNARNGDLDDKFVAGKTFESNNSRIEASSFKTEVEYIKEDQ
ncbi:MAG: hypothetical protein ACK4Z6_05305 [Candidatus Methylomirabilales bacterium]